MSNKKITFVFAIHNHQPVGNFDFVIEEAYQKSYLPFLRTLKKYPAIKTGVHITGVLHEWIEKNHPEMIVLLKSMVKNNQVQMLSGGYYEPILSVIPPADRIGQIEKQNRLIQKSLNTKARGMWLAERVWEPTLPSWMAKAGMEFTVIDDIHFKYAGLQEEQLYNYYITEDLGYNMKLFPISQELRYLIPFQKPEKTIEFLRSIASENEDRIVVFADDGEKFGLWPDTFDFVYMGGWLEKFFQLLSDNLDWINISHFSEVMDTTKPFGSIYLPTASYAEMLHWALPNKAFKAYEEFENTLKESQLLDKYGVFVRGGFWRNFFTKYSESNNLHKKMMRVADKVWADKKGVSDRNLKTAKDHLWAGQCNCPYWHGVFGGLYLPHLRTAIYENLIAAENLMDAEILKEKTSNIELIDFDNNGSEELLIETATQNIYISLLDGGTIFEHDIRKINFNICDTMARREEGYHLKLQELAKSNIDSHSDGHASIHDIVVAKEEGLEKKLFYDRFLPRKLRIHFFSGAKVEDFYSAQYSELSNAPEVEFKVTSKKRYEDDIYIRLTAEAEISHRNNKAVVEVEKVLRISAKDLGSVTELIFRKKSGDNMDIQVGVDYFYSMLAGNADDRYYITQDEDHNKSHLNSIFSLKNTQELGFTDEWKKISVRLKLNKQAGFHVYPVETISLSESGFERVYQASCLMPYFDFNLNSKPVSFLITEEITIA